MAQEIRWFFEGPLPDDVAEWFERALPGEGMQKPEGKRTDAYLATGRDEDDDAGFKMRDVGMEPKFEFKWRTESEKFEATSLEGLLENWGKKSWEFKEADRLQPVLDAIGAGLDMKWVHITKERRKRAYSLEDDGALVPEGKRVDRGFKIELTPFTSAGREWWSLGIDIFIDHEGVAAGLSKLAELLTKDYPGPALDVKHSCGYPAWVLRAVK
jgi:hypothetical protein